jgi:hypothetical protein
LLQILALISNVFVSADTADRVFEYNRELARQSGTRAGGAVSITAGSMIGLAAMTTVVIVRSITLPRAVPRRHSTMDSLTAFGLFAVIAMLVCYAFEDRSRWFILAFAGACALVSLYGFLQGAWPFGFVEAIWSAVAGVGGG